MSNLFMLVALAFMFIRSKNTLTTLLVFLVIMHFLEVVFVELFFGKEFSTKAGMFDSLNIVGNCLFVFVIIFYFFNGRLSDVKSFDYTIMRFRRVDVIPFLLMSSYAVFIYYNSVIVNSLDYHLISEGSLPIDEYLIVLFTVMLICSKSRFLVLFSFILIAVIYGYTGERLKFLVMLYTTYLLLKDSYNVRVPFKVLVLFALFFAIFLDIVRSQDVGSQTEAIHMSHFGELSITSMYLLDFTSDHSLLERTQAFAGIFLGNLIPSSLMPAGFDIKRMLSYQTDVPGGGWLPVWFFAVAGYFGVIVISLMISILGRIFVKSLNNMVSMHKRKEFMFLCFISFNSSAVIWFMYSPYVVFKFIIYSSLIYGGYKILIPVSSRPKTLSKNSQSV